MSQDVYPAVPASSGKTVTVSPAFRNEIRKMIIALILFAVLYLFLLAVSGAFAALCFILGTSIIIGTPSFISFIGGGAVMGLGGFVFFYLVKFLFAKKQDAVSNKIEITEDDQPELIAFIRRVCEETQTDCPRHIYITDDVNAAVFYDNSLRSMFFKVPKNLVIGLGLVNALSISDFKAVLAHEFGHFSQKSMRAGSYIYQANKVIYNLFLTDGYVKLLSRFAGMGKIFLLAAKLVVYIISAFRWVLQRAYLLISLQYARLSRQMEFHADAVAAHVGGAHNLVHALRRAGLAGEAYEETIRLYNRWLKDKMKAENMFLDQRYICSVIARNYALPIVEGMPVLRNADQHYQSYRRVVIADQWQSHPTQLQREAALNTINTYAAVCELSAWTLFRNAEQLQCSMTETLYKDINTETGFRPLTPALFEQRVASEAAKYALPAVYGNYYEGRDIYEFDPETLSAGFLDYATEIAPLFQPGNELYRKIKAAKEDMEMLDTIAGSNSRSFDFDGIKYRKKEVAHIKQQLQEELQNMETLLKDSDLKVFHYYLLRAKERSDVKAMILKQHYRQYFELVRIHADNIRCCESVVKSCEPILREGVYYRRDAERLAVFTGKAVKQLQNRLKELKEMLRGMAYVQYKEMPPLLNAFMPHEFLFIDNEGFIRKDIDQFKDAVNSLYEWSSRMLFETMKEVLQQQLLLADQEA